MIKNYRWYGDEYYREWKRQSTKNLHKACILLKNKIKAEIGTKYPPASSAGTPPHLRTGELRRSMAHEVDNNELIGRVGSNKKYSGYLERGTGKMAKRPYLQPTLEANVKTVQRILQRGP